MAVTARFFVHEINTHEMVGNTYSVVTMQPDYKDGANKDWAKYTPSGKIELNVYDGPALDFFRAHLGKGMHITFDEVPPES